MTYVTPQVTIAHRQTQHSKAQLYTDLFLACRERSREGGKEGEEERKKEREKKVTYHSIQLKNSIQDDVLD